ncbi:hypothetical protein HPB52_024116 [Rhipicephalus sanguineus]|uniref:Uncharacterized protein n=1 Tax=Rhipicephalus sanguineus TaxID=34632 RepID=A0A9D4T6G7_RHISA|nr:hypothetical protein HPB52_024116 [Rhipicephalus sanguineus]
MRLTRGEFFSQLRRFAAGFQAHGIGLGDRICVHVDNSVENMVALFSITFTGASVLLSNPVLNESFADLNSDDFEEVHIDDPKGTTLALFYSSGTTGHAKGMEISHYSLVANLYMTKVLVSYQPGDVLLAWYPITYASGFMFIPVAASTGATCVIVQPGLTFEQFVYYVKKYKFIDLDTGEKVGPRQYGELYFRDIMYYDEDGRVYFVDRMKDMIKCLDQQVSSIELEGLLQSHPSVADAAVVGVPKTKYGDAPAAFVVLRVPSSESPELAAELKEHVASKTEKFKHLYGGLVFVDRLPRNTNGKVIKHQLRLMYERSKAY